MPVTDKVTIIIALFICLIAVGSMLMPVMVRNINREYTPEERGSNTFIDSDGQLKSLDDHEVGVSK